MKLGEKVKELRKKRGINQRKLAKTAGVTQATISLIETSSVKDIRPGTLKGLAAALGVSIGCLVGTAKWEDGTVEKTAWRDGLVLGLFIGFEVAVIAVSIVLYFTTEIFK